MTTTSSPADPAVSIPVEHRVLVVDDSAMDRHLAGSIIQKMGNCQASFAENGVEALAMMQQTKFDLVLTDMLMPEMDGLELVQAIRSKYPMIPVILMTAHGSEELAVQALHAGAASYVPKRDLANDLRRKQRIGRVEAAAAYVAVKALQLAGFEHAGAA